MPGHSSKRTDQIRPCQCSTCDSEAPSDPTELLASLRDKVFSDDIELQLEGCRRIRCLLSREQNPPIDACIKAEVLPRLVQFLRSKDSALQFEASWALTNVASGASEHTTYVVKLGAVPEFVELLRSGKWDSREQAAWALGNIAGDSLEHRNLVIDTDALPLLCELALRSDASTPMLRNCTWSLANLCRGKPAPSFARMKPVVAVFAEFVKKKDQEVLIDACWGLSYLSDGDDEQIMSVVESGCLPRLTELLSTTTHDTVTPVIRTIGNLVTGGDEHTQRVIEAGALKPLMAIIRDSSRPVPHRKEAIWTLSNIAAGSNQQVLALLQCGAFSLITTLLKDDKAPYALRVEGAWVMANATGRHRKINRLLVAHGVLEALIAFLRFGPSSRGCLTCLDGIQNVLMCGSLSWRRVQKMRRFGTYELLAAEDVHMVRPMPNEDEIDHIETTPLVYKQESPCLGSDMKSLEAPKGQGVMLVNPLACWLEFHGGVDVLEALQFYPNVEVQLKARALLWAFWPVDHVVPRSSPPEGMKKLVITPHEAEEEEDDYDLADAKAGAKNRQRAVRGTESAGSAGVATSSAVGAGAGAGASQRGQAAASQSVTKPTMATTTTTTSAGQEQTQSGGNAQQGVGEGKKKGKKKKKKNRKR